MDKQDVFLSSDNFIMLFLTLFQLRLYSRNINYLMADWHFNMSELSRFMSFSKQTSKYYHFLKCFNFAVGGYSIELITAINKAKGKKIITVSDGDTFYISRAYHNGNIIELLSDFVPLMNEFIDDYLLYVEEPNRYLESIDNVNVLDAAGQIDYNFNIFALQRSLKEKQVKDYISKRKHHED